MKYILSKTAMLVLIILVAAGSVFAIADGVDKVSIVRRVADDLIEAAAKQYERALYVHADESLSQAMEYYQYLTVEQRSKTEVLSGKIKVVLFQRDVVLEHIRRANGFVSNGRLTDGRDYLKQFCDSEFLTAKERKEIAKKLGELDTRIAGQGQLSLQNNNETVDGSEDIDEYLTQAELIADMDESPVIKAGLPDAQQSKVKSLSRKEKMQQVYARVATKEAVSQVRILLEEGKFYKAKEAVVAARRILEKYASQIDAKLIEGYGAELDALAEQIDKGRVRWLGSWESRGAWEL